METAVVVNDFGADPLGGSDRVAVSVVEALNEEGFEPDVYSPRDKDNERIYGIEYNHKGMRLPNTFAIYRRAVQNLILGKLEDYDYVFNLNGSNMYIPDRENYYCYIHFPDLGGVNYTSKYTDSVIWSLYALPKKIMSKSSDLNPGKTKVFANSEFTKGRIMEYNSIPEDRIEVLYPPVDLDKFWCESKDREGVVTLGRFSPEKGQLDQIEIAEDMDIHFNIIGSTSSDKEYYEKCRKRSMDVGNVLVDGDVSDKDLEMYLGSSKFFLTTFKDHFGIAVVEAIAAGCVPIVPDGGGPKEIVPFDELRFDHIYEVPEMIRNLEGKEDMYRRKCQDYIKRFSKERFRERIRKEIS